MAAIALFTSVVLPLNDRPLIMLSDFVCISPSIIHSCFSASLLLLISFQVWMGLSRLFQQVFQLVASANEVVDGYSVFQEVTYHFAFSLFLGKADHNVLDCWAVACRTKPLRHCFYLTEQLYDVRAITVPVVHQGHQDIFAWDASVSVPRFFHQLEDFGVSLILEIARFIMRGNVPALRVKQQC